MNEALRDWVTNVHNTFYFIGTVAGPHPYPMMVRDFQSVIGDETRAADAGSRRPLAGFAGRLHRRRLQRDGHVPSVPRRSRGRNLWRRSRRSRAEQQLHAASIAGGRPGVLHGNRTYLLQDDDGQIQDAHSISAGLDYPGVGPEHSWLKDVGRVKYLSATDEEALDAFQLLVAAGRHHPGARTCACDRQGHGARAANGDKDHLMVMQSVRPWRQGRAASRRHPAGEEEVTTRIDARFAQLKKEGRSAFVTFLMAGDPDPETSLASHQGAAEGGRRRHRDRHALHRSDGRRSLDPGRRIARAQAGMTLKKTLTLVREFRKDDDATPLVLMGYYNPIYIYGVDRFLAMPSPPASTA